MHPGRGFVAVPSRQALFGRASGGARAVKGVARRQDSGDRASRHVGGVLARPPGGAERDQDTGNKSFGLGVLLWCDSPFWAGLPRQAVGYSLGSGSFRLSVKGESCDRLPYCLAPERLPRLRTDEGGRKGECKANPRLTRA